MVADAKGEKDDMAGLPAFDPSNVVTWAKRLKMWLMRKKRNHLGLEDPPARPPNNAAARVLADFKEEFNTWLERKDTCVSTIYEAVQHVPDALEISDQYILEKELLPNNDPNNEILAKELLERLVLRFRGEIQDELGDLSSQFTQFVILPEEKVCTGIDRLNGIVQKLDQHGQPPTAAAKLSKLKEALQIPTLEQLWLTISLQENPTYNEIVAMCKRYDKVEEKQKSKETADQVHLNTETDQVVCSYPKCGKSGHTQAQCWKKKKDQKIAQLKRTGKSKSGSGNREKDKNKAKRSSRSDGYAGCHCCGDKAHRAFECPDRFKSTDKNNRGNVKPHKTK